MIYPTIVQDQFSVGRVAMRELLRFDLLGQSFGLCSGGFQISWAGLTYDPFGLVTVEQPDLQTGQAALPFNIIMSARREFGITPNTIAEIMALPWRGAFVTGYRCWLNPTTRAIVHVDAIIEGRVATLERKFSNAGGVVIEAQCETDQIDAWEPGYREYSGADQRLINPLDTSLDKIEDGATEQLWFGRTGPKPQ